MNACMKAYWFTDTMRVLQVLHCIKTYICNNKNRNAYIEYTVCLRKKQVFQDFNNADMHKNTLVLCVDFQTIADKTYVDEYSFKANSLKHDWHIITHH